HRGASFPRSARGAADCNTGRRGPSSARSCLRNRRFMVVSCAPVMEVSRKVMHRAAELLDAGVSFALCTVVSARGSVPGKAGAKMIVLRDGSQFGTVGGAGLEERVKDLGRR